MTYDGIAGLNQTPGLTAAEEKQRQQLNSEIDALNEAHARRDATRRRLEDLDAGDFTAEDLAAAERAPGERMALLNRELALREKLAGWEPVRTRALRRAMEKAEAAAKAAHDKIVKAMLAAGFVEEITHPGGLVTGGILSMQVNLHPEVLAANQAIVAVDGHTDSSRQQDNLKQIERLRGEFERMKSRAVAAIGA